MRPLQLLSAVDQVAAHLRSEILAGTAEDSIPGVAALAAKLSISPRTAGAALQRLEKEGLLSHQGHGRKRKIVSNGQTKSFRAKRIMILLGASEDSGVGFVFEIAHQLAESGFIPEFCRKTLEDLKMSPQRVADCVHGTNADAWIVIGAPVGILEWFHSENIPVFAIFGGFQTLPIAGCVPDKKSVLVPIINELTRLGHRRIVLLSRERRRRPAMGLFEQQFLAALERHGIAASEYNLPHWTEGPEGIHQCLQALFAVTPPTAIILDESQFLVATLRFLSARNLQVPEDVSLICNDGDPCFQWCSPAIAHVLWDPQVLLQQTMRWAGHLQRGIPDIRHRLCPAKFVAGPSVGPAPH